MSKKNNNSESYFKLNESLREWLREKNWLYKIENIQMAVGVFGILSGTILFTYYYTKIDKSLAFIFIIPVLLGIWVLHSTKRGILHDEKREKTYPI